MRISDWSSDVCSSDLAPIQRAIEAGDAQTGVTIMQMDQGLDTGDMLLTHATPITGELNASALHDELAVIGARAILKTIDALPKGALTAQAKPDQGVTSYAKQQGRASCGARVGPYVQSAVGAG